MVLGAVVQVPLDRRRSLSISATPAGGTPRCPPRARAPPAAGAPARCPSRLACSTAPRLSATSSSRCGRSLCRPATAPRSTAIVPICSAPCRIGSTTWSSDRPCRVLGPGVGAVAQPGRSTVSRQELAPSPRPTASATRPGPARRSAVTGTARRSRRARCTGSAGCRRAAGRRAARRGRRAAGSTARPARSRRAAAAPPRQARQEPGDGRASQYPPPTSHATSAAARPRLNRRSAVHSRSRRVADEHRRGDPDAGQPGEPEQQRGGLPGLGSAGAQRSGRPGRARSRRGTTAAR